ncbi:hypothetical protein B0T21DRAFT_436391 [Apiosordaria backusii]|uniref:Uncharacterized protein n=1 Tax=Apiosordaria backusii TaxID=314023 RepID=A0AA40BSH7_9PEZI|nr:hypothetical protein B0T21DRAFT_436391 [Apiosordaria backusii]
MSGYRNFYHPHDEPMTRAEDFEEAHSPYTHVYHGHRMSSSSSSYHQPESSRKPSSSDKPSSSKNTSSYKGKEPASSRKSTDQDKAPDEYRVPLIVEVADHNPKWGKTVRSARAMLKDWGRGEKPLKPTEGYKKVVLEASRGDGSGYYYSSVEYETENNVDLVQGPQFGPVDYNHSVEATHRQY